MRFYLHLVCSVCLLALPPSFVRVSTAHPGARETLPKAASLNGESASGLSQSECGSIQTSAMPSKVQMVVVQNYKNAKDVLLPIKTVGTRLLKAAGVEVIDTPAAERSDVIRINVEGDALGANYSPMGYCYSGARISGSIRLESSSSPAAEALFSKTQDPLLRVFACSGASDAPFDSTFYSSEFVEKLERLLAARYTGISRFCFWMAALKEQSRELRAAAVRGLSKTDPARAVNVLVNVLQTDNQYWDVREATVEALSGIGRPAVEGLMPLLRSKDEPTRRLAAQTLGKIADERSRQSLTDALKDQSRLVQVWVTFALVRLGDAQRFTVLKAGLADSDHNFQEHSALALAEIRSAEAIDALIDSLRSNYSGSPMERALAKITGKDFKNNRDKWSEWWGANKEAFINKR